MIDSAELSRLPAYVIYASFINSSDNWQIDFSILENYEEWWYAQRIRYLHMFYYIVFELDKHEVKINRWIIWYTVEQWTKIFFSSFPLDTPCFLSFNNSYLFWKNQDTQ